MKRQRLIVSIGVLSAGLAACGGYEANNAAYDEANAAYDEANTAYDAGNAAYDAGNAAYNASDGNAAYLPPADAGNNLAADAPPPTTNGY